jgi:hypothetical protein
MKNVEAKSTARLDGLKKKYLPDVHSKLYLVASKLGTCRFPSAKNVAISATKKKNAFRERHASSVHRIMNGKRRR